MHYCIFRDAKVKTPRHSLCQSDWAVSEPWMHFLHVSFWSLRASESLDCQQSKISAKQGEGRKMPWGLSRCSMLLPTGQLFGELFSFCSMRSQSRCLELPLSAELLPVHLPCRKLKPTGSSCSDVIVFDSDRLRLNALCPSQAYIKAQQGIFLHTCGEPE